MIRFEFKKLFGKGKVFLYLVIFALLFILIMYGFGFVGNKKKPGAENEKKGKRFINLGVVNRDGSAISEMLISYFIENDEFEKYVNIIVPEYKSPDEAKAYLDEELRKGRLDIYLDIPEEFAVKMYNLENLPVDIYISDKSPMKAALLSELFRSYGSYVTAAEVGSLTFRRALAAAGASIETINSLDERVTIKLVTSALGKDSFFNRIEDKGIENIPIKQYYIGGAVFLLLMIFMAFSGVSVLNENECGISTRLKTYGISRTKSMLSKLPAHLTLLFILFAPVFFVIRKSILVKKVNELMKFSKDDYLFFAGYLALMLIGIVAFMLMATVIKSVPGYFTFAFSFILVEAIIGGALIPMGYLPDMMQKLALLSPFYWSLELIAL